MRKNPSTSWKYVYLSVSVSATQRTTMEWAWAWAYTKWAWERPGATIELLTYISKLDSIKLPSIWHSNLIIFDAINVNSLSLSLSVAFRAQSPIVANFSASINSVDGSQIKCSKDNTIAYTRGTRSWSHTSKTIACILTLTLNDNTAARLPSHLRPAQNTLKLKSLGYSLNHCRDGCECTRQFHFKN